MSKYPTFNGLMQNSSNLKPLKTQRRNCCQRFTPNFQDQLWLNCTENTRWIMTCLVLTLTKFYIWLVIFLWLKMKRILNQTTFSRSMCNILRKTLLSGRPALRCQLSDPPRLRQPTMKHGFGPPPYFLAWASWLGPTRCRITLSWVLDHAQGCGMGRRAVEPIW